MKRARHKPWRFHRAALPPSDFTPQRLPSLFVIFLLWQTFKILYCRKIFYYPVCSNTQIRISFVMLCRSLYSENWKSKWYKYCETNLFTRPLSLKAFLSLSFSYPIAYQKTWHNFKYSWKVWQALRVRWQSPRKPGRGLDDNQIFVCILHVSVRPTKLFPENFLFFHKSIETLMHMIKDKTGVGIDEQRLIYVSKQLQKGFTLRDYNIQKHSTIFLVLRFVTIQKTIL